MLAIISDIHSNTEALTAVLSDIQRRGAERIACLGDVVGYGPEPGLCLDIIMGRCEQVIMGNHDFAVLYEPSRFNLGAENAVFWTRRRLSENVAPEQLKKRFQFLGTRPVRAKIDGEPFGCREILLAHGSPRRPINEYLFPDDVVTNPGRIAGSLDRIEHLCFVGHTHVPGVFTESLEFLSPDDLGGVYDLNDGKALINVGSVGQPRDRDPRASYALVDEGKITFVRVDYDVQSAAQKVLGIRELDDYLGTRLTEGR